MIKRALNVFKKSVAVAVMVVFAMIAFSACSKENDTSYAISGYVYDELGVAVEGVEIKSDMGTVLTDETGKYEIPGVTSSLILRAEKEGYQFAESSKMVTKETDDANFVAYQNYVVSGTVENNGVVVSDATVEIESLSGKFLTTTDEVGKFYGKNVAGETKISCSLDGYSFYPVVASIVRPDVKVSITSTFSIKFNFDSSVANYDDIKIYINNSLQKITSSNPSFDDIRCGSVVKIESNKYVFSKSMFVIDKLNQIEEIDVSEIYHIAGAVKSGNVLLEGAKVFVDGKFAATTDASGNFSVSNLFGTNRLTATFEGLIFEPVLVTNNSQSQNISFNGTKDVFVLVDYDTFVGDDLDFGAFNPTKEHTGEYIFKNIVLGDTISVFSTSYHLSAGSITVQADNNYNLSAEAYYNAQVLTDNNLNAQILLDGNPASAEDLNGLYGTHSVSASFEDYVFDEAEINVNNPSVTLSYKIPFTVTLVVSSGDAVLSGAKASINGKTYNANQNGQIELENLLDEVSALISCDGYNSKEILVSANAETNVELTYNISGVVKTGDTLIAEANVSAGSKTTKTNTQGEFTLTNLVGSVTIVVEKNNYTFDSTKVNREISLTFDGSYKISGVLSNNEGVMSGITVVLINDNTNETVDSLVTGEDGYYEFTNLTGTYYLRTLNGNAPSGLKPNFYNIKVGGTYDFSSVGFSVSGYVYSESLPVANAYVTAGSSSTITDENGKFVFELLTDACIVSVQKIGYSFSQTFEVSAENAEDLGDIIFNGTYTVTGKVETSGYAVGGVSVYFAGTLVATTTEDGLFTVPGLAGECELEFEREGFVFESSKMVSAPENIEVSCKLKATISVLTGNIPVSGFDYYVNGVLKGNVASSSFEVVAFYDDEVTFVKEGYTISSVKVKAPTNYIASSTYLVSGKALSGDVALSGVNVRFDGLSTSTNSSGEYTLSGLAGSGEITFEKDGFVFDGGVLVSGYNLNSNASASYTISGYVSLGSEKLEGVKVSYEEKNITTKADGKFEFSGVYGNFSLSFEKTGYTFDAVTNRFGTELVVVSAYYTILGKVTSGSEVVVNADVVATVENSSQIYSTKTDVNGEFKLTGLSGKANIVVSKDGYTNAQISGITNYTTGVNANLKYTITFKFDTTDVQVKQNGDKTYQTNNKLEFTISNLEGTNIFTFEKKNTSFSRSSVTIKEPVTLPTITSTVAYDISGSVKTEGGIAVSGLTVYAGSSSTYVKTDENGNFAFNGVAGSLYIQEGDYRSTLNIDKDGVYNFTMSNLDFAFILYSNGFKKLDSAASVQIFGSGEVDAGAGGMQQVSSVFKRDNQGNIVKQNLNSGKEVLGINPTVGLFITYVASENAYKTNKTTSVSNGIATYGSLETKNAAYFKSTYGAYPYEYSPYNVSKDTMTNLRVSINSSGNYEISFSLKTNTQSNYTLQILGLAPSGTTFKSFSFLNHTYEINKDGWILKQYTDEEYVVNKIVNATTKSKITYTYKTTASNMQIDTIDVSNNDAIQRSLKESSQSEIISNFSKIHNYDIVNNLIFC